MNVKMKVTNFLWLVFCLALPLSAQQGFVATGGDIHSPTGSVAYSSGQVAFESVIHESGSVNQGLQQPFHLNIVSISDLHWNSAFQLYPNPASQFLYLQLSGEESITQGKDFAAKVYDLQGKLLIDQMLSNDLTVISISSLPVAVYFIQIWEANTFIQSISFSKIN